jgi:hypothetical protein
LIGLAESGFASCLLLFALNGAAHRTGSHGVSFENEMARVKLVRT